VLPELVTVIAGHDDGGLVQDPPRLEIIEEQAEVAVIERHRVVVDGLDAYPVARRDRQSAALDASSSSPLT